LTHRNHVSGQAPSSENTKGRFQTPDDAVSLRVPVQEGDLIIFSTDGLVDNVEPGDILRVAVDLLQSGQGTNKGKGIFHFWISPRPDAHVVDHFFPCHKKYSRH
jgi:hypothetical protein